MHLFPSLLLLLGLQCFSCFATFTTKELTMGSTFIQSCPLTATDLGDKLIQFVKLRAEVKMFSSKYATGTPNLISNNTDLNPGLANITDRYSVALVGRHYRLTVTDVRDLDSGEFVCQIYNPATQSAELTVNLVELVVPGPLRDLYWTLDWENEDPDKEPVPLTDGATVMLESEWHAVPIACAIFTTNIEPKVNITSGGPFGAAGTTDITATFNDRVTGRLSIYNGGLAKFNSTVRLVPSTLKGFHTLYCRAEQGSTVFEKSVNVGVTYAPESAKGNPDTYKARLDDTEVELVFAVRGLPPPTVEWILPNSGDRLNATSQHPNYAVITEVVDRDTITSTLTIARVEEVDFGRYRLDVVNSKGQARFNLELMEGDRSAGRSVSTGASMTITVLCLSLVTLANMLFKQQ